MKRTQGTKHRAILIDFWSEFLFENKINDDKQPGILVGWSLGHKDRDIITLMKDGSVRYNGSWKYSPEGRSAGKDHELQSALAKMKKHKCKVVSRASMVSMSVLVGNTRWNVDNEFFFLS